MSKTENWLHVAEKLYKHMNPNTRMDTPSSVYETVNKWNNEYINSGSELSLFDWCIKFKTPKK